MTAEALVTDTHPLVWYFCADQRKLSKRARRVFDDAVLRKAKAIYVPSLVLLELSMLIQDDEIRINISFAEFINKLFKNNMIIELPFDRHIVYEYHGLAFTADPFDKAIVATALFLEMPLITADGIIHDNKPCELYW